MTTKDNAPALEIAGLRAGYIRGADVLHDVTLHVGRGEIVALLGRNGAGKSTLLKSVCGELPRGAGTVRVGGEDVSRTLSPERIAKLGVAHVPEGRRVFRGLSVEENLEVGGIAAGIGSRERAKDMQRVYDLFPALVSLRGRAAWALSGGEQQMLALGRGLCARPTLMLMDEPSLGLAPIVVATVMASVSAIAADGIAVLLVEQNVDLASRISHRSYLLDGGRISGEFDDDSVEDREALLSAYLGQDDATGADGGDAA